jgi:hypothetical protein
VYKIEQWLISFQWLKLPTDEDAFAVFPGDESAYIACRCVDQLLRCRRQVWQ